MLFCAVFICNSVRFCGVRTPITPPKQPCTDSPWKHQILKASWVTYLIPSSWVLWGVFFGGKRFWKVLILVNRTFAQEPRWLHGAWWTRWFYIGSSNWIVPNTAHDQARSVDYLRVGRSVFRHVILVTRIPRVHVGLYHASRSHRGSWVHVRLPRTETFQKIFQEKHSTIPIRGRYKRLTWP